MFLLLIFLRAWTSLPERQDYLGGSAFTLNCRITHGALPAALRVLVSSEQKEHQGVTKPKAPAPNLVCQPASCVLDWEFPSLFWKVNKKGGQGEGKLAQSSILFLFQLICLEFCHWPLSDQERLQCMRNSTKRSDQKGTYQTSGCCMGSLAWPDPSHGTLWPPPPPLLTETTHKSMWVLSYFSCFRSLRWRGSCLMPTDWEMLGMRCVFQKVWIRIAMPVRCLK